MEKVTEHVAYIIYQGFNLSGDFLGKWIDRDERQILHYIKDDKNKFHKLLDKALKEWNNVTWEEIPYTKEATWK